MPPEYILNQMSVRLVRFNALDQNHVKNQTETNSYQNMHNQQLNDFHDDVCFIHNCVVERKRDISRLVCSHCF